MRGPDTQVIASVGFPAEAERLAIGTSRSATSPELVPARLRRGAGPADQRADSACRRRHRVHAAPGPGSDARALMVYPLASGLLLRGRAMPYLGVPFTAEGSPEGLLETLR